MKFCTNCGAQLREGMRFCTECGKKILQEEPVTPTAPVYEASKPAWEVPAPVCEEPANEVPAPVCEEPVNEAPAPIFEEPANEVPMPAFEEPANKAPTPVREVPVAAGEIHVYGQPVSHTFSAPVVTESEQGVAHTYGAPVAYTFAPPAQVETSLSGSYGGVATVQPEPVLAASAPAAKPESVAVPVAKKSEKQFSVKMPDVKMPDIAKKINFGSKKIRAIFLAGLVLILVIVLLFCVGGKEDPNQGIYNGINYTYGGFELDASSDWIELKSRGKLTMSLLGEEYSGEWELEGEDLVIEQGGDTYYGTLSDNVMVMDFDGVIYTYEKEIQEEDASEKEDVKEEPAQKDEKEEQSEAGGKKYYVAISGVTSGTQMNESTINQMGGVSLVLNGDGTGTFEMFGQSDEITYDDTTITRYNTPMAYTVDGDYLHLQVSEDIEFTLMTKMDAMNRPQEELTLDDMGYWEGDYYGWWIIDNVIEGNSAAQGNWWDCCMTLDIQSDGSGLITIWDEDYGKDDPIAEVEVSVSTYQGVTRIVSESGQFMGDNVEHADWLFYSDATDYKDSLGFTVTYEDDELKMDCYFFLRRWGTIWDDVEEAYMPGHYEEWYLPLIENGAATAPDTIG